MSDFSLVLQMAALGTGFCFLMTTLGAASVLFTGKESSPAFQRISLGFAAGIMVAASVWSLLIPSLEASSKDAIPWLPATGGFVLGIAFLLLMDKTIPHWHPAEDSPEGPKSNHSRTELLVAAVTLHNIQALFFFLQIIIRAEENQTVTILSCFFSDVFYQLRKKRVGNVGHDHTDQAGLAPYQALRYYIWLKIMLSCTCKNTFPDLWIYCCISI